MNEVTEVARYTVVTEPGSGSTRFTVPNPSNPQNDLHLQGFEAPGVIAGSFSVIQFRTTHSGSPSFSIRLNARSLLQETLSAQGTRSWHVVAAGALMEKANELTLAVNGQGSVTFLDIVIHYKANKTTVPKPIVAEQ